MFQSEHTYWVAPRCRPSLRSARVDLDSMIRELQSKREVLNEAIVVFERLAETEGRSRKEVPVPGETEKSSRKSSKKQAVEA